MKKLFLTAVLGLLVVSGRVHGAIARDYALGFAGAAGSVLLFEQSSTFLKALSVPAMIASTAVLFRSTINEQLSRSQRTKEAEQKKIGVQGMSSKLQENKQA